MATLRNIHQYMNDRVSVVLDDGREGKIVRVTTAFPACITTVSVYTDTDGTPGIAKVELGRIIGAVPPKAAG